VCIQQGRLFFEAAEVAPIQIKPLQIYYGIVAFAKAVVVAKRGESLSTLTRGHGLKDVTPAGSGIEELTLQFENGGTFQEFNDAIAPLGRIWYFENSMPRWFGKPFDLSGDLSRKRISIKDVLSRVPGLSVKYKQTFGSSAASTLVMLHSDSMYTGRHTLRIDDPDPYADGSGLIATIRKWRTAYPFLDQWRFVEATHAWGAGILVFDNAAKDGDDLADLIEGNNSGFTTKHALMKGSTAFGPIPDILPPLSGGYISSHVYSMQPFEGVTLPEYSLQFLGSFVLSSLVRYRPQIWQNAISRSVTAAEPADDRSLSLIEAFLDDVLHSFPMMVVRVIDYQRTR
jgi:hypothetical protein